MKVTNLEKYIHVATFELKTKEVVTILAKNYPLHVKTLQSKKDWATKTPTALA
ncbi:hypothetical protein JWV37_04455 [Sulfurospirillum sp. T05]|uniref:Uncharacterized protein n=1 Tax=Sulfurospirillum tamanense TaxID=2813362 RepID=A0ABS2WQX4_9BACT|nr:hypothetical protein [Sulfurospirillum tamanensis]MBN2964026.1 hypothetical protein [Sulfurospirillum tamanensis]